MNLSRKWRRAHSFSEAFETLFVLAPAARRQHPAGDRLAQNPFGPALVQLLLYGDAHQILHDSAIQIRLPDFTGMRHGHSIFITQQRGHGMAAYIKMSPSGNTARLPDWPDCSLLQSRSRVVETTADTAWLLQKLTLQRRCRETQTAPPPPHLPSNDPAAAVHGVEIFVQLLIRLLIHEQHHQPVGPGLLYR